MPIGLIVLSLLIVGICGLVIIDDIFREEERA